MTELLLLAGAFALGFGIGKYGTDWISKFFNKE